MFSVLIVPLGTLLKMELIGHSVASLAILATTKKVTDLWITNETSNIFRLPFLECLFYLKCTIKTSFIYKVKILFYNSFKYFLLGRYCH